MTEPNAARIEKLLLLGLFLVVAALFIWIASPEKWLFSKTAAPEKEYYNLLVDGFSSGKLSLNVQVPAALKALKDPYDPLQNGPYRLHDASYYNGAYYLYFGVTPALVLFWPYHTLTGGYLSQAEACVIFSLVAVAAAFWTVRSVKARFFGDAPAWKGVAAALGVGVCTMVPCLLSRINIYEVAIASGLAFSALSVSCVFQAFTGRRHLLWLAGGSLSYGLAVASRPSLAFGAVLLLFPAYHLWKGREGSRPGASFLKPAAATLLPIGCIAVGMLAYNYLRFGNPLEFGVRYQLATERLRSATFFSLSNFLYNVRVCLGEPTRLSIYFPYVKGIAVPPVPEGYFGVEDAYGILTNIPVLLFGFGALCLPLLDPLLRRFTSAVLTLFVVVTATTFMFGGATNRYLPEFAFPLAILTAIGALALTGGTASRRRLLLGGLWIALLGVSVGFNLLAAFSHENLLELQHPRAYASLSRALNWPSYLVRRVAGARYGPVSMTLELPKGRGGAYEPLLVSGIGSRSDYLYLHYLSPHSVALGFEHTSHGGPSTEPIPIDFDRPHVVTVEAGFFYPPDDDPYLDRFSRGEADALKRRLRIIVDGDLYLDEWAGVYDPVRLEPMFGTGGPDRPALGAAFTGRILEHHPSSAGELQTVFPLGPGPMRLVLKLPAFSGRKSEPLVSTGATARGDLLYLTYLDPGHISLSLDHWSVGGPTSPPIPVAYGGYQRMEISLGSCHASSAQVAGAQSGDREGLRQRLFVSLNGAVVFDAPQHFYDSTPEQVEVGKNAIGSSTSAAVFTGSILYQKNIDPAPILKSVRW